MHPSQLSDILVENFPSLASYTRPLIHEYADLMLHLAAHNGRKHRSAGTDGIPSDAMSIHCRKLQNKFGLGSFECINEVVDCIGHTRNWRVDTNETKAYWLNSSGKRLIEEARKGAREGVKNLLLAHNGTAIRKRANGIFTARDTHGRNAVTNAVLDWAVPVNLQAINFVLDVGVEQVFPDTTPGRQARTETNLSAIHACALNDNVGRGLIPQTYREVASGRLYGFGSPSLQNVTREAKRVALMGEHEFDFVNCHYRLMGNVSAQNDLDTLVINEYLGDPESFRQVLADELGTTCKKAKECLLARLNGATPSNWPENAIPMLIGPEKARHLCALPMYEALSAEIREVGSWLIANAHRTQNGAIINCRGKACSGNARQELAHLLQGMEAELLHVVMQEYRNDILIIQHDGFTMSRYINPEEIEALISYETGIDMPVTYEHLTLPGIS